MDCSNPGSSGLRIMTRNELYTIIQSSNEPTFDGKLNFMEQTLLSNYSEDDIRLADMKKKLSSIKHQFKQKWLAARKTKARFEENNAEWLNGTISLPSSAGVSTGRPEKSFVDSSERGKRRKTEDLRSKDVEELVYATQMKLRKSGKVDASKIVKDLTKSPQRAKKYAKAMKKSSEEHEQPQQLSPLLALSMFTEAGLTKAQYERIRETNKSFFPCYSILQKVKRECYPEIHRVTETCVEVQVQKLMDHTASRLILHLGEDTTYLSDDEKRSLILISKWGCDRSQQMQYKMKFENESDSDANIFQSSVVPLQLIYGPERKILWQNPKPSSPRYCRPIRLRFIKETTDITNEEIDYIKSQITALSPTEIEGMSIKHKMLCTMVDGKVCNAGADVIKEAILPIGQLSEEAAEARNKHIRSFRLNYTRKFSRVTCNQDVLNRLLLTSDPLITGMRCNTNKKRKPLSSDVLNLLCESDLRNVNVSEDSSSEE